MTTLRDLVLQQVKAVNAPSVSASGSNKRGSASIRIPVGKITLGADGYYDERGARFTRKDIEAAFNAMGLDFNVGASGPYDESGFDSYRVGIKKRF